MNRSERKQGLYVLTVMLLAMSLFSGCPKKTEVTATPEVRQEAPAVQPAPAPEQAQAGQAEKASPPAEAVKEQPPAEKAPSPAAGLQPVYFDFDKASIRADARETLKANADWLKAHPKARIRIEGNCDERGTKEYNQALGQRRAASAKKYLTSLGIAASRISLISYGKERPACSESTEDCWQKNRRDDFVQGAE